MRISATYFDGDGAVFMVCSLLTSTNDQAGIDAAVRSQWNNAQIVSASVLIASSADPIIYAAKP